MGLEEQRVALEADRQAQIGATAERILLSYAEKKPQNFLSVGFAREIRTAAEVLYGAPAAADPLTAADVAPDPEAKPEVNGTTEGELDLDAG